MIKSARDTINQLGKDAWDATKCSQLVAGDDLRVQAEVDPGLALGDDQIALLLSLEELESG